MYYKGVIIEESLDDKSILRNKDIKIISTRIEKVNERHKTSWINKWTLHTVEINEDKAKEYGISLGIPSYQVNFHSQVKK